ncbi:hypothetical protein FHS61_001698 [Altererythrobacter atlanticus]|uniref:Uncharacterized protein n=1 Tax=Croceibacterium atlanticum TaxID=1267766 RepID=A0A0F7KKS3_9SPHN|nr:hypothetical protein [Croceibacterium atlanticum]AKH41173.1 hypothetical protein WYH_00107 [Croceibacterium atlanticum]MBB5732689.1 hypothetical protein [Croceibacterium atlanticum]
MMTISKALVGTFAAGAMAMASASPTLAQDRRHHRDNDGIDAGDVIAGALIIGGIAAVAAAASNRDDRRYRDRRYRDRDYRDNPRNAVEQCVRAAERTANRYSYGGRSKVTDIRDVDRKSNGYKIKGRIAVNQNGRDWRRGDRNYGRGWDNDYRGWNDRYRGYDSGRFTCRVKYGRVVDIDYSGIRGL